jgi:hypothetical protein
MADAMVGDAPLDETEVRPTAKPRRKTATTTAAKRPGFMDDFHGRGWGGAFYRALVGEEGGAGV